ncbi:hypothetical protein AKJ08_3658 [Vulgatibacter incomptus]|uniref:Uncharacterized protein n=2 Tax=Vulgatibacter incomptus TaxID=1391653 RepID=A0A0K1PIQ3_9BACT|nr:hypothetical protein AKJ08_3658 [Vulgatibacter incomptus]
MSTVAVDDEYIYFTVDYDEIGKFKHLDRLYRYRLDQFDSIGEPMN